MNGVRLVIVVPCYNEEEVLKETTRQLSDVLARMEQEGRWPKERFCMWTTEARILPGN